MTKSKAADFQFEIDRDHTSRVVVARWCATPTVGTEAHQAILAIQIRMIVATIYPIPPATIHEPINREAVFYISCRRDRLATTQAGSDFLRAIGVALDAEPGTVELEHKSRCLRIQFGPPDPLFGYQSLATWDLLDPREAAVAADRATRLATKIYDFGLSFPNAGVVLLGETRIEFTHNPLAWHIFKCLADRYPEHYQTANLMRVAWHQAKRDIPRGGGDSVRQHIKELRKIIESHKLGVEHVSGLGYRLKAIAAAITPETPTID